MNADDSESEGGPQSNKGSVKGGGNMRITRSRSNSVDYSKAFDKS